MQTELVKKECAVCHRVSDQEVAVSYTVLDGADLDLRPGEQERGLLHTDVMECPFCHYCWPDIEENPGNMEGFLQDPSYLNCCEGLRLPALAIRFFKNGRICEEKKDYKGAMMAFLRGAWACDDGGEREEASVCRLRAAENARKILESGREPDPVKEDAELILLDMLRVSGRFDEALGQARKRQIYRGKIMNLIADFQVEKSRAGDEKIYTIEDAVQYMKEL